MVAPDVRTIGVIPAPGASASTIIDKVQPILPLAAPLDLGGVILFSRANASSPPQPPLPDPPYPGFGARLVTSLLQWAVGDDGWVSPAFYEVGVEDTDAMFFRQLAYLQVSPEYTEAEARLLFLDFGLGEALPRTAHDPPGFYRVRVEDRHVLRALDRIEVLRADPEVERATLEFGAVVTAPAGLVELPLGSPPVPTAACTASPFVQVGVWGDGIEGDYPNLNQPTGPDQGWSCFGSEDEPCEEGGEPGMQWDVHETSVAGVISGCGGTNGFAEGIARNEAKVYSVKAMQALNTCNSFDPQWLTEGYFTKSMDAVEDNHLKVVNISWDLTEIENSVVVNDRLRELRKSGFLAVAAAGNSVRGGDPGVRFPATNAYVLAVSGLNETGTGRFLVEGESMINCGNTVLDFQSNFGPEVAMSAQGERVITTDRTGDDGYVPGNDVVLTGTSWASPLVAGAAARLIFVNPDLSPGTLEILLCATATDIGDPGRDDETGCGRIDDASVAAAEMQAPDWLFADGFETSSEDLEVEWSDWVIEEEP